MTLPLVAAALLAAAPAPARAFPYPVHTRVLPNGLRIVLVPYDSPRTMAYFTVLRVGSRNEIEPGRSGFAHFFEHLSFRGTPRHSGADWERITKSVGLDSNAFTDDDVTAYWLAGPSSALPTIVPLEADRFLNLAYTEDAFKVEARAVLGEFLKDMTSPEFRLDEAVRDLAFTRHTYKHSTMGFERDVRQMPTGYRYSLDLYRRFYRPDNALVIVVGDFDEEEVAALIAREYGAWRGKNEPAIVPAEPAQDRERDTRVAWAVPVLPRLYAGYHTPGAADLHATAVQLVLWPLLFGRQSPLYRELVFEKQLAEEVSGEFQPHRDPFLFGVEVVLRAAAAEAPARAALERALAEVAAGRVDPHALADVKDNLRNTLVMETDTPYRTGTWLVYYSALTGEPDYLSRVMEEVARVEPPDLATFAARHLRPENRTTVILQNAPGATARGAR